ncbi:MAG TPA: hypothetical protein VMZ29_13110 [Candidatus Bathyarchaeia archaeon]|nr:hypothetical protein [Candidatus Bathyarchaeia archaeon]
MSSDKYCPFCGGIVKVGDVYCNNCGASIEKATQPVTQVQYPMQQPEQPQQYGTQNVYGQPATIPTVEKNQAADNALVFGVIGLFCTPMAIAAIVLGIIGMQKPYGKSKAVWGIILGVLVLLVGVGALLIRFIPW